MNKKIDIEDVNKLISETEIEQSQHDELILNYESKLKELKLENNKMFKITNKIDELTIQNEE